MKKNIFILFRSKSLFQAKPPIRAMHNILDAKLVKNHNDTYRYKKLINSCKRIMEKYNNKNKIV